MPNTLCQEPWTLCDLAESTSLDEELVKEISEEHPLFGVKFHAISKHKSKHQVLFHLKGAEFNWVVVHMTMQGKVASSELPEVDFYISFDEWQDRCMSCAWY